MEMAFLKSLFRKGSVRHRISDRTVREQHAELLHVTGMTTAKRMLINEGEDDEMEIFGYRNNKLKAFITYVFVIITCGFLRLFFHWVPHWYLYATSTLCPVTEAHKILIVEVFKEKHKIYHVKRLKILTSDSVLNIRTSETGAHVVDPQLIQDLTETQPSLCVHYENGNFRELDKLLMFSCKKVTYIWNSERTKFEKLRGLDVGVSSHKFHENSGLSSGEAFMRRMVYGLNKIHIQESSIMKLLFLEVLNPFYIFQIASFILWFLDNYYYYAMAIMIMSVFGISMTVMQTRKNERNLRATVHSSDVCKVLRRSNKSYASGCGDENLNTESISTERLVPGDILEIPSHGCIMHCDAVLLTGNCILNESMLTGESVPVTKTSLPNIKDLLYDPKEHAKHTLFCGTQVIQTRYFGSAKVLAVVVRTGFSTAKGSLVRSILYPPPVDFKFEKDSYKFVACMACIATLGFAYTVVTKVMRHVDWQDLIVEALDLITIVIPPALPAAMTVGSFYAQIRLKKNQIFCISPRSINVSGSVNCVCFDKTGTLTEDGLDLRCVVPVTQKSFANPVSDVSSMSYNTLFFGLVSCHSLTIIDKKIVGDPLDLKMFESTRWIMEEPEVADNNKFDLIFPTVMKPPKTKHTQSENLEDQLQIGIIREFPFSSSLQRMGVIIRKLNAPNFEYYCKGSPEMLLNFIDKSSLPSDFHEILENYTQDGYRVIAIAHKTVKMSYTKIQKVQRETLEKDMVFLGLIILENRLKPETAPCIQALNDANVRIIMVTGDNILTALSVARDCDIVKPGESVITVNCDNSNPPQLYYTLNNFKSKNQTNNDVSMMSTSVSVVSLDTVESQIQNSTANSKTNESATPCNNYRFAMTGKVWGVVSEYYSEELLAKLVTRGTVFARMAPEQKQALVQELQGLGYYVAMCGDGANDCGALKAAHTGVSLSDAESSVASPFTSKNANISCVINVIKEGRAALVTSFGIFKYMAAYSLCQFISVLILYHFESNLTDMEFLYIDLCIISVFAFFFGKTGSYPGKLVKQPPLTSLLSLSPIVSLVLQLLLIIVFQLGSFFYLQMQSWYVPFHHDDKNRDDVGCLENYTIFTISSFQYIGLAIIFSKGKPYRKSIVSNRGFLITSIVLISVSVYLALAPHKIIRKFLLLVVPDDFDFRLTLATLAVLYFLISFLIEHLVVDVVLFKRRSKRVDKSMKYVAIDRDLNRDTRWPQLTAPTDFTSPASPDNSVPTCTAEIVVEKENKFDKNHVLNKLYNGNSAELNESVRSDKFVPNGVTFSTPLNSVKFGGLALKTMSDNNLNRSNNYSFQVDVSDTTLNATPTRYPNLKKFEPNLGRNHAISEDLFSSVQSNFNKVSSGSDTFKSLSPDDENVPDLPYDGEDSRYLTTEGSNEFDGNPRDGFNGNTNMIKYDNNR